MDDISNLDDIINSRDVIERIEELEELIENREREIDPEQEDDEEQKELDVLKSVASQGESYAEDWTHGEAMIREDYFETYAQQLAEDCGMVNSDARWPNNHIDWEAAANDLKGDYTEIDFDGVTYFMR